MSSKFVTKMGERSYEKSKQNLKEKPATGKVGERKKCVRCGAQPCRPKGPCRSTLRRIGVAYTPGIMPSFVLAVTDFTSATRASIAGGGLTLSDLTKKG